MDNNWHMIDQQKTHKIRKELRCAHYGESAIINRVEFEAVADLLFQSEGRA